MRTKSPQQLQEKRWQNEGLSGKLLWYQRGLPNGRDSMRLNDDPSQMPPMVRWEHNLVTQWIDHSIAETVLEYAQRNIPEGKLGSF